MHGIHIAADLIAKAKEQGKVKKAYVEIGKIANISATDLRKQLKNFSDFPFAVTEIDAKVQCQCGYEGPPQVLERQHDLVLFNCPLCHKKPNVLVGDKIILKSVEVA